MTPAEAFISFLGMALVQIAIGARGAGGGGVSGVSPSGGNTPCRRQPGECYELTSIQHHSQALILQYNITHKP